MNSKLKTHISLILLLSVLLAACSGQKEPISTNRNKGDSGTVASTESTGQADGPSEAVSEEPEEEEVVSRIDYFDKEGERKYFEKYAYYDNGLLCSSSPELTIIKIRLAADCRTCIFRTNISVCTYC